MNLFVTSSIVFMSLIVAIIYGQHICDSYVNNGKRALIYSVDNRQIFVLIDKDFWILTESDGKFIFTPSNRQAFGYDKHLGNRIATLFNQNAFKFTINGQNKDIIVFYDGDRHLKKNSLGWMYFDDNQFKYLCDNGVYLINTSGVRTGDTCGHFLLPPTLTAFQLKNSLSFQYPGPSTFPHFDVFLVLKPKLSVVYMFVEYLNNAKSTLQATLILTSYKPDNKISNHLDRLQFIDSSLNLIGLFRNELTGNVYVFIGTEKGISYCNMDKCLSNEFEELIDCSVPLPSTLNTPSTSSFPNTPSTLSTTSTSTPTPLMASADAFSTADTFLASDTTPTKDIGPPEYTSSLPMASNRKPSDLSPLILLIVVFLIVIVVITAVVVIALVVRKRRSGVTDTIPTMAPSTSSFNIATVNSETGLPINRPQRTISNTSSEDSEDLMKADD